MPPVTPDCSPGHSGRLAGDDGSKAAREADRDQPGDDGTDREGGDDETPAPASWA
jgi:hypothetical protein